MSTVKWVKIVTDVFDDEKILLIESMPEADSLIVIWFKLLCLAGKQNNNGVFMMNNKVAYTDKMLSTIFRRKETTVALALTTFEQFGMIEIVDNVITIPNWEKHQNIDGLDKIREDTRLRVAAYREKQKKQLSCNVTSPVTVTHGNALEEEKKRKEEEKKRIEYLKAIFKTFYSAYPRKQDNAKAEKAFIKLSPDDELFEVIMKALEAQKKSKQWQDKQYIPLPASWLNGKRWEDEVTETEKEELKYGGLQKLQ